MLLSAYCLSYGNWTVIPHQWDRVFSDMKACGFDAVDLSFSESEERYAMRTFEQQVAMAHRHGLKVFVIPSRIGGRFAGAPLMPSCYLAARPELQTEKNRWLARLDTPDFIRWSLGFVSNLIKNFPVDGIIWDEPKSTLAESDLRQLLDYLAVLTAAVRELRPELSITLFNMPSMPEWFTRASVRIPGIDYAGFDGSCSKQSYFHEAPVRSKPGLGSLWKRTLEETAGYCGRFGLIENMLIPTGEGKAYEKELESVLEIIEPDHLACYYYGHNNEDAEWVQKVTMKHIGEYRKAHKPEVKHEKSEIYAY